ncbi:hypothetical protein [Natrinema salaciae]|uniref:Uncharacterized protein n=1 Tax=Natrinema salaciae TaxID=1186196 RepID=A0A1H9PWJ7_9EURY|nr:hypothetical protein [Natrinema salaciae]SER52498.1 hypothetical protein SAMN04489841_4004 [Natrinema salaciae]
MTDTPAEIIETVRRAHESGDPVRVDATDGMWVISRIDVIDIDAPLGGSPQRDEPSYGETRAVLHPEDMMAVEGYASGGSIHAEERRNGCWERPTVGWATEVDDSGSPLRWYSCEIASVEVVSSDG